jgi:hypothetical protein
MYNSISQSIPAMNQNVLKMFFREAEPATSGQKKGDGNLQHRKEQSITQIEET